MLRVPAPKITGSYPWPGFPIEPWSQSDTGRPLVINFGGTLIRGDVLVEGIFQLLRRNPIAIFSVIWWIFQGRAVLKKKIAERAPIDPDTLPFNEKLVAFARAEKASGRKIILATAADDIVARRIAAHCDFIDEVLASDGVTNLKGAAKADALATRFPAGFDFAGDAGCDLAVWERAKGVIIVEASPAVTRRAERLGKTLAVFPRSSRLHALAKGLRLHQWAKNALVFVPLLLGGKAGDLLAWRETAMAFVAIGLVASATYLLNDLWDLPHDRAHWAKKNRPLASGHLPILTAGVAMLVGLVLGLAISAFVGWPVLLSVVTYLFITMAYSLYVKRVPILDALSLGTLFTLRLAVGVMAAGVIWSPWLLTFSMFLFTSLSFAKRHVEIRGAFNRGNNGAIAGRGYHRADEPVVLAFGIGAGITSVAIFILYLTNENFRQASFHNPLLLWAFPPILFLWVGRIWILCAREELADDPVAFAVKDRTSLCLGAIAALVMGAAAVQLPNWF
jgi:4-hydroxybenzoate polyprenyltransferase